MKEKELRLVALTGLNGNVVRENVLSGAGRKRGIYATNQVLPRQIQSKASIHSITQKCSSSKTKNSQTRSQFREALTWRKQSPVQRLLSSAPLTNGAHPRRWSRRGVDLSRRRRTKYSETRASKVKVNCFGFTLEELMNIPAGRRRKYHDDVTVIVIMLGTN
ncbi:hypothetical protein SO802_029198 [Lithocarpus litseifolius]|uniref:Uncharacterized protein n=1 Tax=Lithocarpus litseifolius TaxID=425828 RepID=A0AAW2BSR4_9ROSI